MGNRLLTNERFCLSLNLSCLDLQEEKKFYVEPKQWLKVLVVFHETREHKKVWLLISSRIADFYEIKIFCNLEIWDTKMSVDIVAKRMKTNIFWLQGKK